MSVFFFFFNILDNVPSFHYVAVSIQYWLDLQTKQSKILCPSLPGSWRSSTNPQFTANARTYITVQSKISVTFLANFISWLTKDPMGMVNPGCFTVSRSPTWVWSCRIHNTSLSVSSNMLIEVSSVHLIKSLDCSSCLDIPLWELESQCPVDF